MLDSLFATKMRIQIPVRSFLNASSRVYLCVQAMDCAVSPGRLCSLLRQSTNVGLMARAREDRQVLYRAKPARPLFPELHSMVLKALGMDRILESIIEQHDLDDLVAKTKRFIRRNIRTLALSAAELKQSVRTLEGQHPFSIWGREMETGP